jgi:hypothetical protein
VARHGEAKGLGVEGDRFGEIGDVDIDKKSMLASLQQVPIWRNRHRERSEAIQSHPQCPWVASLRSQ